jgi:hypothetical protein
MQAETRIKPSKKAPKPFTSARQIGEFVVKSDVHQSACRAAILNRFRSFLAIAVLLLAFAATSRFFQFAFLPLPNPNLGSKPCFLDAQRLWELK